MISEAELLKLMADLESDRVERTNATNDTTKFREAICAFSNDLPNHRLPGYLLIGVQDKTGKACGLKADDALLRNLACLRQDGEILRAVLVTSCGMGTIKAAATTPLCLETRSSLRSFASWMNSTSSCAIRVPLF